MNTLKLSIKDYLQDIISEMKINVPVTSITDNGDGTYTIETCDTQFLRTCSLFEYDGSSYMVDSFVQDEQLVLSLQGGTFNITVEDGIDLPAPLYFHGTIMLSKAYREAIKSNLNKTPFIYLYEIIQENYNNDRNNATQLEASVRLFFMDDAKSDGWYTETHYEEVITPMRALVEDFIATAERSRATTKLGAFTILNHANWGEVNKDGHFVSIFGEKLSGVELRISIPIKRNYCCKTKC